MIEAIRQQLNSEMNFEEKLNRTREFLQILALKILSDHDCFKNLAFTGGTALRFLYDVRRFSEDLDFSLIERKGYDFPGIISELVRGFKLFGLEMDAKPEAEKTVNSSFLKFIGLLKQLNLSPLIGQKLSIKVEIDTNPPKGGVLQSSMLSKKYVFSIVHFDLPSLFATKISACFYRKYIKGRDFYDLIWHLSKKTQPNYLLLNNAIKQTQGYSPEINENNLKEFLLEKIEGVDFTQAKKDVERFLEDKGELRLFNLEALKQAINSTYKITHRG